MSVLANMTTSLNVGSVVASDGANNFVGIFHGPVTVENRDYQSCMFQSACLYCEWPLICSSVQAPQKPKEDEVKDILFLTDPQVDRESIISTKGQRVAGTCEWVTEHPQYLSWLQGDLRLLWVSGGPGKGKTVMSIFLTEELERTTKDTSQVLFYFCSHQDEKRNTAFTILRSLIWQLIKEMPSLSEYAQPYFVSSKRSEQALSSMETLWMVFRSMITDPSLPRIHCVLDGLDECDEPTFKLFVPRLVELLSKKTSLATSTSFRLIIVSREIFSLRTCERIKLDPDNNDKVMSDIEHFVFARVQELSYVEGFDEIRDYVINTLLRRAEGTFLWVGFAMFELLQQSTCTELLEVLEDIPTGLSAVYSRMLLRIPVRKRDTCLKLLRLVFIAIRPLSLAELAAAMNLPQSLPFTDGERRIRDEVAICGPILKLQGTNVELVHQSARDYLQRLRCEGDGVLEPFHIQPEIAHLELARVCLELISKFVQWHRPIALGNSMSGLPHPWTLLHYSISHALQHVQQCGEHDIEMLELFQCIYQVDRGERIARLPAENHWLTLQTPLFGACFIGMDHWVLSLTQPDPTKIDEDGYLEARDEYGRTALHVAAVQGHHSIVEILLDHGADIDARDNDGFSAVMCTAERSNRSMVDLLLNREANVNLRTNYGQTLLTMAISAGQENLTRFLVAKGSKVHVWDANDLTPLHIAAYQGETKIVQLLMDNGADVEAVSSRGRTALHIATWENEPSVVRLLVQGGANITARDAKGRTALHLAALIGADDLIVELLLRKGADVMVQDEYGETALDLAHTYDMIRRLLKAT